MRIYEAESSTTRERHPLRAGERKRMNAVEQALQSMSRTILANPAIQSKDAEKRLFLSSS